MTKADGELIFLHISDIHFGAEGPTLEGPNAAARDRTLEDLADGFRALGPPDALLVSGDIAFSGKPEQYELATAFLEQAAETVGIEAARVQVIPGNHDVDWDKVQYSIEMPRRAIKGRATEGKIREADELLRDYLVKDPSDPLFSPMSAYQAFAAQYDCHVSGSKPYWDQSFDLGTSSKLLIRGLTTSVVSDWTDNRANVLLGTGSAHIQKPRNAVAMVLAHHPPDWWADSDLSKPMMRDVVSLALFGHKHTADVSLGDNCVSIIAGAVNPERQDGWHPHYQWLGVALEDEMGEEPRLRVNVWPRRFDPPRNKYVNGGDVGGWDPEVHRVKLIRFEAAAPHGSSAGPVPHREAAPAAKESWVEEASQGDIHALPDNVVSQSVRSPLESSDGSIQPQRSALYNLLRLGYVQRHKVMVEFDLSRDGDDELSREDLQVAIVERASEQGVLSELMAVVADLVRERDGMRD